MITKKKSNNKIVIEELICNMCECVNDKSFTTNQMTIFNDHTHLLKFKQFISSDPKILDQFSFFFCFPEQKPDQKSLDHFRIFFLISNEKTTTSVSENSRQKNHHHHHKIDDKI